MSNKEANEFVEKLNAGLELAEKRMLQEKSKRGESVVIYTEDKGSLLKPEFKSINSSLLSFLYNPTLTSIHDYWRNHSFD